MPQRVISTAKETALLTKLERLPVLPRRKIRLCQFADPNPGVLSWYHGVTRKGRRYSACCEVLDDGAVEVSFTPVRGARKATRTPRPRHCVRDPLGGRLYVR